MSYQSQQRQVNASALTPEPTGLQPSSLAWQQLWFQTAGTIQHKLCLSVCASTHGQARKAPDGAFHTPQFAPITCAAACTSLGRDSKD